MRSLSWQDTPRHYWRNKGEGFDDQDRSYDNRHIGIYHAELSFNDQNHLETFVKPDSPIRFVICTVAFGSGVHIPDIRIVMHWGICESVLQMLVRGRSSRMRWQGFTCIHVCH